MAKFVKSLLALLVMVNLLSISAAQGQTDVSSTSKSTPSANAKGVSPLGSFGGSGFDKVNLFNGNLSFTIPLASLNGRNGLGASVVLSYNSKMWRVAKTEMVDSGSGMTFNVNTAVFDEPDLGTPLFAPGWLIHAGRMIGRQVAKGNCATQTKPAETFITLTTLTFTAPDGTEYDFRDELFNGQPIVTSASPCPSMAGTSRGRFFRSTNGTAATFVSDTDIFDALTTGNQIFPTGTVLLRDGTRFRISNGRVVKQTDTNGNVIRYEYSQGALSTRLTKIIDTLGRVLQISYFDRGNNAPPESVIVQIDIKENNNAGTPSRRVIKIYGTQLGQVLRDAGANIKTYKQLYPDSRLLNEDFAFNPNNILSRVELPALPDDTSPSKFSYQFKYNTYGEVSRVVTPAGGMIDYNYTDTPDGGINANALEIFRRVKERLTYPNGTTLEGKTLYSDPALKESGSTEFTTVQVEARDSANLLLARTDHRFLGNPMDDFRGMGIVSNTLSTGYKKWQEGKEVRTIEYDIVVGSPVEKRRIEFTFEQRAPVTWLTSVTNDPNQPENDPRLTKTKTTLKEPGSGLTDLVSEVENDYDQYNNVTAERVYGFGNGVRGGLLRTTSRSYITINPVNNINYVMSNANIHIRSLVASETITGIGGQEAQVSFEYDNYALLQTSPLLVRSFDTATGGTRDSEYGIGFTARGNLTKVDRAGISISYSQYDIAGNVIKTVGPRGETVNITFSPTFHFAYPTSTAQNVTEADGRIQMLTTSTNYDFVTGLVLSSTDFNLQTTSFTYNDVLDRLTMETRPDGGTTSFTYSSPGLFPAFVQTDTVISTTNRLQTTSFFDGFLRPIEQQRTSDPGGIVTTKSFYDGLGRAFLVSNPHRNSQGDNFGWTVTKFDGLSRVVKVASYETESQARADVGSVGFTGKIITSYLLNTVTVTDQADKKRKSTTDALGRLTQVDEPDSAGNLTLPTNYSYDARGNLKTVAQGVQSRTFNYDALSRLTNATTPESGTISFAYDASSNLISRTDARNIVTNYTYDELNRVRTKSYTGSASTPNVNFYYDNTNLPAGLIPPAPYTRGFALGRLVAVVTDANVRQTQTGTFYGYDQEGTVTFVSQLLDGTHYQSSASYNLAGLPISESYPSGALIATEYNNRAQITKITRTMGTSSRVLASNLSYAATGALEKQELGNSLHHSINYNSRLQPITISLGTTVGGADRINIVYEYGVVNSVSNAASTVDQTKNNGNVAKIKLTPGNGTTTFIQNYSYDELNRVKDAAEYVGTGANSPSWTQTFQYDRYGNKKIFNEQNQEIPISTVNNRITGAGYGYDLAGNLTQEGAGKTYEYDAENRMFRATIGSTVTEYFYDGNGRRIKKVIGGTEAGTTRFIYNGFGKLVAEYEGGQMSPNPQKEYYYGANGLLAIMEQDCAGKVLKYTTPDTLGTTRVVTSMTGAVLSRHDYFPFGEEILGNTGGRTTAMGYSINDRIKKKFTGYERDDETGLDFAQARYYANSLGRFMSPDEFFGGPIELFFFADEASENPTFYADVLDPQTFNKYQYCLNNPLSYVDQDGHLQGPVTSSGAKVVAKEAVKLGTKQIVKNTVTGATAGAVLGPIGSAVVGAASFLGSVVSIGSIIVDIDTDRRLQEQIRQNKEKEAEQDRLKAAEKNKQQQPQDQKPPDPVQGRRRNTTPEPDPSQQEERGAEHTSGARPSTKGKHQKGRKRKKEDRPGGEKGDQRRPFRRGGKNASISNFDD